MTESNLDQFIEENPIDEEYKTYENIPILGDLFVLYLANGLEDQVKNIESEYEDENTIDILIPIGIPGSGKTTFYENGKSPNSYPLKKTFVHISGDDIRFKLFGYKVRTNFDYIESLEPLIKLMLYESIKFVLTHKKSIFIDECNTNLNEMLELIKYISLVCDENKIKPNFRLVYMFSEPFKSYQNQKKRQRIVPYYKLETKYEELKDNFRYAVNKLIKVEGLNIYVFKDDIYQFKNISFSHPYYKLEDEFFTTIRPTSFPERIDLERYDIVSIVLNKEHIFFAQVVSIKKAKIINISLDTLKRDGEFPSYEINDHIDFVDLLNSFNRYKSTNLTTTKSIIYLKRMDNIKVYDPNKEITLKN